MGYHLDPNRVPKPVSFTPVPPGEYEATIVEAAMKTAKTTGTQMLALRFDLTEDPYAGRPIFVNFNVEHPDDQTRGRAEDDMHRLHVALGVNGWDQPEELIGCRCVIKLRIKKGNAEYPDPQNAITDYSPASAQGSARAYNDPNPKRSAPARTEVAPTEDGETPTPVAKKPWK